MSLNEYSRGVQELVLRSLAGYTSQDDRRALDQLMLSARARQDAVLYATVCDSLGITDDGIIDPELYQQAGNTRLEEEVQEYTDPKVRKKDLSELDYRTLGLIFRGVHNITVPEQMHNLLHADELAAIYTGTGVSKSEGTYTKLTKYEDSLHKLVGSIEGIGYPLISPLTRVILNRTQGRQEGESQYDRLQRVTTDSARIFTDSFFAPYRPLNSEQPNNTNAVTDPNIDGRNKRLYVDAIWKYLK